jgi:hypothetical protein
MDIVNVRIRDRASGQLQSAESVEREKSFAERADKLAQLRVLRLQHAAPAAPPKRRRKPA